MLIFELDPRDHLSYQHLLEVRVWCYFYILLHQPPSALFSRFQKVSLLVTVQRDILTLSLISGGVIFRDATLLLKGGN